MNNAKDTPRPLTSQSKSSPPAKHQHQPSGPAIVSNAIYTSEQVRDNLGVSNVTLSNWVEFNGLKASKPGTSKNLFYGQHLIDFILENHQGITKPKNARERNALRRANGGAK